MGLDSGAENGGRGEVELALVQDVSGMDSDAVCNVDIKSYAVTLSSLLHFVLRLVTNHHDLNRLILRQQHKLLRHFDRPLFNLTINLKVCLILPNIKNGCQNFFLGVLLCILAYQLTSSIV